MTKKNLILDWLAAFLFKTFGPVIRLLSSEAALFLGRRLGDLWCLLDYKHRAIVYANLVQAFGSSRTPRSLKKIVKKFYQNLGQSVIEIFLIPKIDKAYIDKYVKIEGFSYIEEGLRKNKGLLLVSVHAGSWELANITSANLGMPFSVFVRDQRYPRLGAVLNRYRLQKGCRLIHRKEQTRKLIEVLRNNEAIGLSVDQGGKEGVIVDFFGRSASMASGAVRLALKYDAALIPVFFSREKGPHIKISIHPPFVLVKTSDNESDIRENLQSLVRVFEDEITLNPAQYLWSYRVWKYSSQKNVLIISDGKTGHLRQSQAIARQVEEYYKKNNFTVNLHEIQINYKNIFQRLISFKPDVVISTGSSVAGANLIFSRYHHAKSLVAMKPPLYMRNLFDLIFIPRHDKPQEMKNVLVTEGALNIVDKNYLEQGSKELSDNTPGINPQLNNYVGILLGGDTKKFSLSVKCVSEIIKGVKANALKNNIKILATSSRRTSIEVEELLEKELAGEKTCSFLVLASRKNPSYSVSGILGLSKVVVVSPESISMVSEAAKSMAHTIVFDSEGLSPKHRDFLSNLSKNGFIKLVKPELVSQTLELLLKTKDAPKRLDDRSKIQEALERIL